MVQVLGLSPEWFFPADSVLDFISALFALSVCVMSYRAYHFSQEKKYMTWSLAFFLLAAGGIVRIITNILVSYSFDPLIFKLGYASFILATIGAYALVLYLKGDRARTVGLMYLLTIMLLYFSNLYYKSFYLATFLFTAVIAWDFFDNTQKRGGIARYAFIAFLCISLAQLLFLVSLFYPLTEVGHVLQFIGFGTLFVQMRKVGK